MKQLYENLISAYENYNETLRNPSKMRTVSSQPTLQVNILDSKYTQLGRLQQCLSLESAESKLQTFMRVRTEKAS
jgi:hypothetical protein